ncbi:MAG: hypothetical protein ACOZCL_15470 [Bacillota bacterium]
MHSELIDRLLKSEEPSIRYRVLVKVLKENPNSAKIKELQEEIRTSKRVQTLLHPRTADGRLEPANHVYHKWHGAHWVLAQLAELGYPEGDASLHPIRDQLYEHWLSPKMLRMVECSADKAHKVDGVPVIDGKPRRCASQQGNALFSTLALGIHDDRAIALASLLVKWQWPDGGWNCDKNPEANVSSFTETHIPLRALALYTRVYSDFVIKGVVKEAAEVFLSRYMFKKKSSGEVLNPEYLKLHYPCYWHYDILFGLKIMAECGYIRNERCSEALDMLESKALRQGGWAADAKFYKTVKTADTVPASNTDKLGWGETGKNKLNEWVTTDVLYVLTEAGRLKL